MTEATETQTISLGADEPVNTRPAPTRKPRRATKAKPQDEAAEVSEQGEQQPAPKKPEKAAKSVKAEKTEKTEKTDKAVRVSKPPKESKSEKSTPDAAPAATSDAAPAVIPEKSAAQTKTSEASVASNSDELMPRRRRMTREGSRDNSASSGQTNGQSSYSGSQNNGYSNGKGGQKDRKQNRKPSREAVVPQTTRESLEGLKAIELRAKAAELEIDVSTLDMRKRDDLVEAVLAASMKAEGFIQCAGLLDLLPEGYGFLRTSGYLPSETDVYVGMSMIRRNGLRKGDWVTGQVRPSRENEKYAALQRIDSVNGMTPEELTRRAKFSELTPVYPDERLVMEHGSNTITARTIDLVAPIGKGQRGLIVSPPKAGKTTILKDIAAAISANDPEVHLMCLLVDERPEEVTDMERSIKGEVVSSTFDMPSENHIAVAELVIERAKRLVETGKDVVILLDSITRLARAYNLAQPASGRILSGGVDSTALYPPKRFLGAARNIEGGGSLTILASALVDTGSKMDEVIFEEFKGTGNMELKLDRDLSDRRVFPAIDPVSSGTRKEELLLDPQEAPLIWAVRRILANIGNTERSMEMLIKSLKQTNTNAEFLLKTAKKAQAKTSDSVSL